ncbi:MAG: hypothetical protein ACTSVU_02525 [Promethearchaeota archaeon]
MQNSYQNDSINKKIIALPWLALYFMGSILWGIICVLVKFLVELQTYRYLSSEKLSRFYSIIIVLVVFSIAIYIFLFRIISFDTKELMYFNGFRMNSFRWEDITEFSIKMRKNKNSYVGVGTSGSLGLLLIVPYISRSAAFKFKINTPQKEIESHWLLISFGKINTFFQLEASLRKFSCLRENQKKKNKKQISHIITWKFSHQPSKIRSPYSLLIYDSDGNAITSKLSKKYWRFFAVYIFSLIFLSYFIIIDLNQVSKSDGIVFVFIILFLFVFLIVVAFKSPEINNNVKIDYG